jgi:hypothetical protein
MFTGFLFKKDPETRPCSTADATNLSGWWFFARPTPLKNDGLSSSVGMMTFHSQLNKKS